MRKTHIVIGAVLLMTSAAQAEERQARIEVSGLWCPSCPYIVGEAFQKSPSVEIVSFEGHGDGELGVYTIAYDDALTSLEAIAAQPAAYGYTAVLLDEPSNS